jgi:excisionase family DNA binding protein
MRDSRPDLGRLEPYVTAAEIAEVLCLSPYTIRSWLRRGVLESTKVGREFRVKKSVFDAYLNETGLAAPASELAIP